ncbi:MAG: uridine kinase [Proteobacteria bacterium]|jgi:uridine kinase|nr:uridine kinase [Pseudomonadota bacterium]
MKTFIIGVAGGSGSGKSTVTEQIISSVGHNDVSVMLQDNYYLDRAHLTMEERNRINFDHPDAFDWALMNKQLDDLYHGLPIQIPDYDFTTHTRKKETKLILPAKVIIVEGIFALYDEAMCNQMSLRIFVDTAADIRLMRRLKRDIIERARTMDSVLKQYGKFVRPMYRKFVEPTKRKAHIIIPHGSNKAAIEMIISRIQSVLNGQQIIVGDDMFYDDDDSII